jgi:hypothetical protein
MTMPDRLIPILSLAVGALVTAYVSLVVVTIFYATWQTQLVSSTRQSQAAIADQETQYYDSIARIDQTDPLAAGYVKPKQISYVTAAAVPGLTFAGR